MGAKTVFFDFDETLVDTSMLRPYRRTDEGRRFIAEHPAQVDTSLIDPDLLVLFNELAQRNLAAIATNSARDYTKTLLEKHGFTTDIPIYYNMHKPCHDGLSRAIKGRCDEADDALYIGDSASDIIASHGCRMPSVAVTWGNTSTLSNLKMAEPTKIVQTVKDLKTRIRSFYKGELKYVNRINPKEYIFFDKLPDEVDVKIHSLYQYFPTNHPNFRGSRSNDILRFKDIKDFSSEEIRNGATGSYFHNGAVRQGLVLKDVFIQFLKEINKSIKLLELKGKSYALAAPNSAPEFCYKSDVNQIMVNNLNRNIFDINGAYLKRLFFRVFPKRESHLDGARDESEHFKTIGVKKTYSIPKDVENLIIFDDITTTGTQIKSLGKILKTLLKFDGNLISITLGKTIV